jgi:hypothetical protein
MLLGENELHVVYITICQHRVAVLQDLTSKVQASGLKSSKE